MSESKHTPGPWLYRPKSDSVHKPPPVQPYIYGEQIFRFDEESFPSEADLALILAAPDLLEAAEKALNYITNTESELGMTLGSGDALREAIRKATGG